MDKILLSGLQFFGKHGCHPAENELGQMFVIDIEIDADLQRAADSDDLNDTINYVEIYNYAGEVIGGPSAALLEHLAAKIGDFALRDERVMAARVAHQKAARRRRRRLGLSGRRNRAATLMENW